MGGAVGGGGVRAISRAPSFEIACGAQGQFGQHRSSGTAQQICLDRGLLSAARWRGGRPTQASHFARSYYHYYGTSTTTFELKVVLLLFRSDRLRSESAVAWRSSGEPARLRVIAVSLWAAGHGRHGAAGGMGKALVG